MRVITARFNSVCAQTGKPLKKGTLIQYDPTTKKAYHIDVKVEQLHVEHADILNDQWYQSTYGNDLNN